MCEEVYPELGDTRTKLRFAFLPMLCGKEWVWLERVLVTEEFTECRGWDEIGPFTFYDWRVSSRAPNMHHLAT